MTIRPLIGITSSRHLVSPSYLGLWLAVRLAGGQPRRICAGCRNDVQQIDGLILAGGTDVSPFLFHRSPRPLQHYDRERDTLEIRMLQWARRRRLPLLAICRGAQLLNVAHGGSIHMAVHKAYRNARYPHHPLAHLTFRKMVQIAPASLFGRICGVPTLTVNSLHRQSIDRLGSGLQISACEANGVIQAIEDPSLPFYLGVQFHPELLLYRAVYRRLFRAFINSAAAERVGSSG
ncbi:MAG: gamma-glutamyl-gamma-aminobutyrate hydrolase family protein [Spirochaetaceae bacterium]|nr:MAG: gamma-glutamyl-gamma-aminobutyrate hydrolase family protein [Spirochaetaceae bacterium]